MNKGLIIIGAGGHGRVIADIAQLNGYEEILFLDDDIKKKRNGQYQVAGTTEDIDRYRQDYDFIVGTGDNAIRKKISDILEDKMIIQPVLVHPSAVIDKTVCVQAGTVIMANAVINADAAAGKGCIINTAATVDHDCVLEDYVHISPGAHMAGGVHIGEGTWIGTGASIINNLRITSHCIIGAGSTVIRDIEKPGTYVGVPSEKTGQEIYMRKILILANNDVGLYKFRKELIEELLRENEVYISLPYGEMVQPLIDMGCHFTDTPVDRRGINPVTDLKLLRSYSRLFRKVDPDLILTYTIKPNIYGGFIAGMKNITYAVNITGLGTAFQSNGLLRKFIVFLYKAALRKVKTVFFENEENRNIFVEEKIIHKERTCVLNGAGVDLEEYPFTEYPSQDRPIRFLFIGRIMKEKGIDELLYAAERIRMECAEIQIDIVGPMEDDYREIIDKSAEKGIINYYGFQTDVKPFIRRCHCFVLPSYHEGMANTLLECASMGRPLITSDIPGCREAVHDSGYLCKVRDRDDLYEKMRKFIEADYEERKKMGINSRRHMEEVFDKRKVVEKTVKELNI